MSHIVDTIDAVKIDANTSVAFTCVTNLWLDELGHDCTALRCVPPMSAWPKEWGGVLPDHVPTVIGRELSVMEHTNYVATASCTVCGHGLPRVSNALLQTFI